MQGSRESTAADVAERWSAPEAGRRYARDRFRSPRAAGRDPRLLTALLRRYAPLGPVLDVPAGSGRLRATLESLGGEWHGADVSLPMLAAIGDAAPARRLAASAFALPFATDAFPTVVCCRLLHHLAPDDVRRCLRELTRVASRRLAVSFWDARSLHAWRHRRGAKPDELRRAIPKRRLVEMLEELDWRPRAFRHSLRFVSQQAFLLAEPAER